MAYNWSKWWIAGSHWLGFALDLSRLSQWSWVPVAKPNKQSHATTRRFKVVVVRTHYYTLCCKQQETSRYFRVCVRIKLKHWFFSSFRGILRTPADCRDHDLSMFPYFPNWDKIQQRSDCEARHSALVHLLHVWISLNIPYNSRERAALAQYSDTGMVTSRGMMNKSKVFIIHLCWAYLQLAWKNENRDSPESLSLSILGGFWTRTWHLELGHGLVNFQTLIFSLWSAGCQLWMRQAACACAVSRVIMCGDNGYHLVTSTHQPRWKVTTGHPLKVIT